MFVYILREHRGGEENGRIVSVHANPQKIMDELDSNVWVKEDRYPPAWWATPDAVALVEDPECGNMHLTLQGWGVN